MIFLRKVATWVMYYKGLRLKGQEGSLLEVISPKGSTIYTFAPSHTKSIIESLDNLSDAVKNIWLSRYKKGALTGVIWERCDAGITLLQDGQVIIGRGGNILPNGGSLLVTF